MIASQPAVVGTVSHGTLRPEDLIPAFDAALRALGGRPSESDLETLERVYDDTLPQTGEDLADVHDWLLESLSDGIEALLPVGWRFGTHEGDGSDFGVWEVDA